MATTAIKNEVNSTHPNYDARKDAVKLVRDTVAGTVDDLITGMPGHDATDAEKFKERAYFLPATNRTREAYVGMVMSKPPVISGIPESRQDIKDDITLSGEPLNRMASRMVDEILQAGQCAVVVDYPETEVGEGEILTQAAVEARGYRAYASFFPAEAVINWRTEMHNGRKRLAQVRLFEVYERPVGEFEVEVVERIRVLSLSQGFYTSSIYERTKSKNGKTEGTSWDLRGTTVPRLNGSPLDFIPCFVCGVNSLDIDETSAHNPPLYPLAKVNISHLNNSASLEWALLWVGSPTMFIAGRVPTDADGKPLPIRLGSSMALVMEEGAKAEILQASADSLGALRQSMEDKRRDMATIGSRTLLDSQTGQISTETDASQNTGERSTLAQIAESVSDALTKVVTLVMEWSAITPDGDVAVNLNTDYAPKTLTAQELTAWVSAVQGGALPRQMFLDFLKKRGVAADELTLEQFEEDIEEDMGADDTTVFEEPEPNEDDA